MGDLSDMVDLTFPRVYGKKREGVMCLDSDEECGVVCVSTRTWRTSWTWGKRRWMQVHRCVVVIRREKVDKVCQLYISHLDHLALIVPNPNVWEDCIGVKAVDSCTSQFKWLWTFPKLFEVCHPMTYCDLCSSHLNVWMECTSYVCSCLIGLGAHISFG